MASSHNAPPATLDCALEVGPDEWRAPGFYQLLTAWWCRGRWAGFRRFRRAECATSQLCACETCRTRCRGCKVSQVLLALCLSAVSYYDDAMSEVEPARGPFNIAYSGFKRDPVVRRLCSGGGDAPQPAELAT
jgi:hypothetical protein